VKRLESESGHQIKATFTVDEKLIAGAVIQLGDHQIDSSVRAQLRALRTQLSGS